MESNVNVLVQILMGILVTIILGISSWSLLEQINHGKILATMQVHISNVSARLGDLEK